MGVLNVTPDSFSDGGLFTRHEAALAHARQMVEEGADVIDVGGESTRPGSQPVPAEEQKRRVVGVIAALRKELPEAVRLSVDTTLSEVAEAAIDAGADMLNDISGGRDPGILALAARHGLPLVLMHMQGTPVTMQDNPSYGDVVAEVEDYLLDRARAARKAGVPAEGIFIDPGIGFGKTYEHNLALLRALPRFVATGYPILLGTSRKRFMRSICRESEPRALTGATCATTALGVEAGVRMFRVHDVRPNRQAADVAWTLAAPTTS